MNELTPLLQKPFYRRWAHPKTLPPKLPNARMTFYA